MIYLTLRFTLYLMFPFKIILSFEKIKEYKYLVLSIIIKYFDLIIGRIFEHNYEI